MTTALRTHSQAATGDAVVLRQSCAADAAALRRLAELDSAAPLRGEILLAERGGELAAALELHGDRVVADPFTPTAGLVTLLEARAALLRRATTGRRRRALPLLQRMRSAA